MARETYWELGIYDVDKKQGILEFIDDWSQQEVIPKITDKVEVGSIICIDQHKTYLSLSAHGYKHRMVNHLETFKASAGTHANHVKAYFSRLKAFLRKKNATNVDFIPSHIDAFVAGKASQLKVERLPGGGTLAVPPTLGQVL